MPASNKIKYIVVHTSDSKWGDVGVIRQWHTDKPPKGRGWSDIGYHFVITNGYDTYNALVTKKRSSSDGIVAPGRPLDQDGAHCVGFNQNSIGICLVGAAGNYTEKQILSLERFCINMMKTYNIPVVNVIGHYETKNGQSQGKTCPDIDMKAWRNRLAKIK